jgi:hypothetical protein
MVNDLEKTEIPGAALWNKFMVQARPDRGDLVGSMAFWGFVAMLAYLVFCGILGGSWMVWSVFGQAGMVTIPQINGTVLTGLLAPACLHLIKAVSGDKVRPKAPVETDPKPKQELKL